MTTLQQFNQEEERRFDDECPWIGIDYSSDSKNRKWVMDFIASHDARRDEKIREMIIEVLEKKKQPTDLSLMELSQAQDIGYNQAIRHAIETIEVLFPTNNK